MDNNRLVMGILAHVDAGKTTLSEAVLYLSGSIRQIGRVDHGNAFLDTYELERQRGITIFSKQAEFKLGKKEVTLLDTPGHVDFSAEMERTLQVLDYAVLVISGADGVQGHVLTLWRLLKQYRIPVFLFINKMDQPGTDRQKLLAALKKDLDERCVDFDEKQEREIFLEELSMCDEGFMEKYLEHGSVGTDDICDLIEQRKVFPCYFGSALKLTGVEEFLAGVEKYARCPCYPDKFGAKIYKISRDDQGVRLTHMKITGGSLKVKMLLSNRQEEKAGRQGAYDRRQEENARSQEEKARSQEENARPNARMRNEESWEEKADQIRIYSGAGYSAVNEALAGMVCAVTGLSQTYSGEGLGIEAASDMPVLEPVLTYRIEVPPECDVHRMYLNLKQLEEEEPELRIVWDENLDEIHAQVMGEVQIEILKTMIKERFGVYVEFGEGNIVYKETILESVEGVGHFEPLRHYAEVHLLLEPGEKGSGLQFRTACSEDILDKNWQRLVLTHLEEKVHRGVLTGAPITDMTITLLTGRSHLKHTEGGDFRQATYRAVRQGLKKAKSCLLEPYYEFRLEVPGENIGRAMSDIQKMYGNFAAPELDGEMSVLTGSAPVSAMRGYQREVNAYTRGRGRLFCSLKGYEPCHNEEEVIEKAGYDSEKDLENPTGSVFCAHGAGFVVNWDQVEEYMHLESVLKPSREEDGPQNDQERRTLPPSTSGGEEKWISQEEIDEILGRTYGNVKRERNKFNRTKSFGPAAGTYRPQAKKEKLPEYLLVDGYNIIFAWEELKELAQVNIASARDKLMDILCNYQGYKKNNLILVFDAYKVQGGKGDIQKYHNIYVVYTKEAETADQYIEKTVHEIGKKYEVTVATSDALEQVIILGQGARRMSAMGLKSEIEAVNQELRSEFLGRQKLPGESVTSGNTGEIKKILDRIQQEQNVQVTDKGSAEK